MDQEIKNNLEEQDVKLNAIYETVEKIRKYFQIIMWVTIVLVGLPALGLLFAIPRFINTYTSTLEGLL